MSNAFASEPKGECPLSARRGQPGRVLGGFVLAEVLVVSVIVAILAVVAVPIYTGMIKSQRREVAKNIAQSGAISANGYYRRYGSDPNCASPPPTCVTVLGLFLPDPSKYAITISSGYIIVTDVSRGPTDSVQAATFYR